MAGTMNTTRTPQLAVIIVNWNGWQDTVDCLESLFRTPYANMRVIVVDNGSTNASLDRLREVPYPIELIATGDNLGFAGGNNRGIQHALGRGADLVWLLNNDTVVEPGAPERLVRFVTDHASEADFFGSWVTVYDEPDRLWFGGGEYDHRSGTFGHRHFGARFETLPQPGVETCAWITGCSLLIRAATLQRVGLMDEDLFLYREEVEWQLRASSTEPHGLVLPEPLIRHKVGRSTGNSSSYLGAIFMSRNFLKLTFRHGGRYWPWWLLHWAIDHVAKPLAKRDLPGVRGALASLRYYRTPGKEIVTRVTGR